MLTPISPHKRGYARHVQRVHGDESTAGARGGGAGAVVQVGWRRGREGLIRGRNGYASGPRGKQGALAVRG